MEAVIIKRITEEELAKELRIQYIQNPPEGMTSDEVRNMSDEDLLDMDYFYMNLMIWMMTIGAKKVFISSNPYRLFVVPCFCGAICLHNS